MNKNALLKICVIAAIASLAVWYLYPSFLYYSKSPEKRIEYHKNNPDIIKKVLNLGLDLQGGMRLVLEIDRSSLDKNAQKDVQERAFTVIENRINGLGVAEPTIQKQGSERIIVELPGLRDESAARRVLGSTAQLEFNLLSEPSELQRAIKVIDDLLAGKAPVDSIATSTATADSAAATLAEEKEKAKRVFESGTTDTVSDSSETTEKKDVASFSEYLVALGSQQVGVLDRNKPRVDEILDRQDVKEALGKAHLGGNMFLWGHETEKQGASIFRPLFFVKTRAELRGDIINDAVAQIAQGGMDAGQWEVSLEMNRDGARKFSRITGTNVGKFLAIVLDSTVYSAPQIREKIPYGRAQISGNFSADDSRGLAVVLRAGALPAPVKIIEHRTIGPSLGQDSINLGSKAALIGTICIFLFMMFYYRMSGVYANIALFFNMLFVLAGMASINQTLTLPGIAGLVLNLGMAVDSNVLICERIREELESGKTIRTAIAAGYSRAFVTIMDSNLTTLITAFILIWVGTGPIKGFGVTLAFGLVISLFTSLFITRLLYTLFTPANKKTLSI